MTTTTGAIHGMAGSYNENSRSQMGIVEWSISLIREAIDALDIAPSSAPLIVADYGSSHGFNSMYVMKIIVEYLKATKKIDNEKQVLVVHNDLPTNEWTYLFELLNKDNSYYGVASGRSFYESCLPSNSLSIGYSSCSVHWLSRKPCNLSNHCTAVFAQGEELVAFQQQARIDLAQFLKHRSCELKIGGVLVVTIWSTDEQGWTAFEPPLNLLYKCAQSLSLLTHQELFEYSLPFYIRLPTECIDLELFDRCSLKLMKSMLKKVKLPFFGDYQERRITLDEFARSVTQSIRSWTESALRQALEVNGRSKDDTEQLLNSFWALYEKEVKDKPHDYDVASFGTYVVLQKVPKGKQ